jgi:predicted acylesterase/phospholipase RssA
MSNVKQRTAFVFAGGGSLGAVQVGMLRELLHAGVRADFVIGSSVGAMNAAYFAGAADLAGVDKLEKFPPVRIGEHHLFDGAVASNTPILTAANLGATRIVVLPTGYACAIHEPPKGAIARALHALTLLIAHRDCKILSGRL